MEARGITMIDAIQGPPRWEGPDVLLRQTSFRALAEPRTFRTADGEIVRDALRVRFGEVEARGIALTREGRAAYDAAVVEIDEAAAAARAEDPGFTEAQRQEIARDVWQRTFPTTEAELAAQGLGWFTYEPVVEPSSLVEPVETQVSTGSTREPLVETRREPVVYEDFLPRSAAGIFQSNLTSDGAKDATQQGTDRDADWMSGALGRELNDPFDLYADQVSRSLAAAAETLGVDPATLTTPNRTTGASR
jgi:uncharacterized glyoxalase superfamily metalloenzyme YdcJ